MAVVKMLSPLDAKAVVTAMWKWSSPLDGNVSPLDAKAVVTAMWKRSSPLDGNAVVTAMCKRSSPLGAKAVVTGSVYIYIYGKAVVPAMC